jgi:hypothetical protein
MPQSGLRRHQVLLTDQDAAVIFVPRHFRVVGFKAQPRDVMVDADLDRRRREKNAPAWFALASSVE